MPDVTDQPGGTPAPDSPIPDEELGDTVAEHDEGGAGEPEDLAAEEADDNVSVAELAQELNRTEAEIFDAANLPPNSEPAAIVSRQEVTTNLAEKERQAAAAQVTGGDTGTMTAVEPDPTAVVVIEPEPVRVQRIVVGADDPCDWDALDHELDEFENECFGIAERPSIFVPTQEGQPS